MYVRVDPKWACGSASCGLPFSPQPVKKILFRLLARMNKALLPKQWDRDLSRLSPARKMLAGYRYWVTRNALD